MTSKEKDNVCETLKYTGMDLFRSKGYSGTGLQEIINKAKTSKGGFYYYFKNKEDFAVQVIETHANILINGLQEAVKELNGTPMQIVKSILIARIEHFDKLNYKRGSLLVQLLTEATDRGSPILKIVNQCYDRIYDFLAERFYEAQKAGELSIDHDPRELAVFVYCGFEGALIKARAEKSKQPLETYKKFVFAFLDSLTNN